MKHRHIITLMPYIVSCIHENKSTGQKTISLLSNNYYCAGFINNINNYQFRKSLCNQYYIEMLS